MELCVECGASGEFSKAMKKRKKRGDRRCVSCSMRDAVPENKLARRVTHRMQSTKARDYLPGHQGRVFEVSFCESQDWLLSASEDGTAAVWDIASNSSIARLEHDVNNEVLRCDWGPDGRMAFTGGADGTAKVWRLSSSSSSESPLQSSCVATIVHDAEAAVGDTQLYACHYLPSQSGLLTGGDHVVKLWDVEVAGQSGSGNRGLKWQASLSQGGSYNLGGVAKNPDQQVYVFDTKSGSPECHAGLVACALSDGSIQLVDPRSGAVVAGADAHRSHCTSVRWVPGCPQLLSCEGGEDALVKLWDVRVLGRLGALATLKGHKRCVWNVECLNGVAGLGATARDTHTADADHGEHDGEVGRGMQGAQGSDLVAMSLSADRTMCLWDLKRASGVTAPCSVVPLGDWAMLSCAVRERDGMFAMAGSWQGADEEDDTNPIVVVELGEVGDDADHDGGEVGVISGDRKLAHLLQSIDREGTAAQGHSHGGQACQGHNNDESGHRHSHGGQASQEHDNKESGHGHSHGGQACHGHGSEGNGHDQRNLEGHGGQSSHSGQSDEEGRLTGHGHSHG